MAFNPRYAARIGDPFDPSRNPAVENAFATPGRPVNIRRDIADALEPDLPPPANVPAAGPSDFRDRLTGAAAVIGAGIDPQTESGPLQFLGGVARGFAGVQQYLQAVTGQRTQATADAEKQKREGHLLEAQTDYYRAGAEERRRPEAPRAAPTPAADNWEEVRNRPVGALRLQINRRTGETKPVLDPEGRPLRVTPPPPSGRGTGSSGPRPVPKTPEQARQRAQQLQREGKTRDQILATMRAEGYEVE